MSHMLPIYLCDVKGYLGNFSRIVAEVSKARPMLRVIDVGANVGDTLALICEACPSATVLCVEGDPAFFGFLSRNAAAFGASAFCENSFLGTGAEIKAEIKTKGGTSLLTGAKGGTSLRTLSLRELLDLYPAFFRSDLIKVDTDGFDALILDAGMDLLGEQGPLIFAEVDAGQAKDAGGDWAATIQRLVNQKYVDSLWWTNLGQMICRCDLTDAEKVADLLHFLPGGGNHYSDVLFARAEHEPIVTAIRNGELQCV